MRSENLAESGPRKRGSERQFETSRVHCGDALFQKDVEGPHPNEDRRAESRPGRFATVEEVMHSYLPRFSELYFPVAHADYRWAGYEPLETELRQITEEDYRQYPWLCQMPCGR